MKKLLKYIVLTLIGIIVIDLAMRPIFNRLFDNPPQSICHSYHFAYNKEQSDILILGASRATRHYNSMMLIDSLGKTCFNAGQDGQPIYNQYLNLLNSLQNGKVETVFLDLSSVQISDKWITERLEPLVPFYWANDTVRAIIDNVSDKTFPPSVIYLSSLIQYNSQFQKFLRYFSPQDVYIFHGYIPLPYSGKEFKYKPLKESSFTINDKGMEYLSRIASVCKKNNIDFYIIVSPSLRDCSLFYSYISDYCRENDIKFLNYSNLQSCIGDLRLWQDYDHMNSKGADIFTAELIKYIKSQQ